MLSVTDICPVPLGYETATAMKPLDYFASSIPVFRFEEFAAGPGGADTQAGVQLGGSEAARPRGKPPALCAEDCTR